MDPNFTTDPHERAKQAIVTARVEGIRQRDQQWLEAHLDECGPCSEYALATQQMAASVRSVPVFANPLMVRATQLRARMYAAHLRERESRLRPIWLVCLFATLWAIISTPYLHTATHRILQPLGVSDVAVEGVFLMYWFVPAMIAVVLIAWLREPQRTPEPLQQSAA